MSISRSIVEAVRSLDPPGRFLEKNPHTGLWSDIGHKKAVEKTSQALRDGAASLRKQLSADLGDPDFLNAVFDGDDGQEQEQNKNPKKKFNMNSKENRSKAKEESALLSMDVESPTQQVLSNDPKKIIKVSDKLKLQKVRSIRVGTRSNRSVVITLTPISSATDQDTSEKGTSAGEIKSLCRHCEPGKVHSQAKGRSGNTNLARSSWRLFHDILA